MYIYVELWKAKPEWLELSKEAREEYMSQLGPAMEEMAKAGIEIIGWALNDEDTPHRGDYSYIAVWKMPTKEFVLKLEENVEAAEWHKYFEQINARGVIDTPETVIGDMINL